MKLTLPDGTVAEGTPEEMAAFAAAREAYEPVWYIDAGGSHIPRGGCQCPSAWFSILPPPCPVHNPSPPSITTTSTEPA
jgi:hypothetical protein